jgi:glycosyltransferase involved in cell wall biosynthesis
LEQCAQKLGIEDRVTFFDPVPHEELPWLYAAVDMLVVPSYYESFSMVTAEALASGTPVIASDVSGPASLIHDGLSGYLVQPGDIKTFAQRIELLLDDTSLRETLARSAPATVAHLDWQTVAEKIISAYSATLDGAMELTPCAN